MSKVIIELEFDNRKNNYQITDAEVYNYLNELIENDCLSYEIKEESEDE
tara:strand:- start:954 stop:1100 length:147 start_codon:yes stop_codon:yes gene_type:complete